MVRVKPYPLKRIFLFSLFAFRRSDNEERKGRQGHPRHRLARDRCSPDASKGRRSPASGRWHPQSNGPLGKAEQWRAIPDIRSQGAWTAIMYSPARTRPHRPGHAHLSRIAQVLTTPPKSSKTSSCRAFMTQTYAVRYSERQASRRSPFTRLFGLSRPKKQPETQQAT